MKKIQLLDTSIGTSNLGDFIIMECVRKELAPVFEGNFVYNMPTHLPSFSTVAVLRNSYVVQNYTNCDLKFAGGSNLLTKNLKTHYPQWNIHFLNYKPLKGVILVGVGAGAGNYTNAYTEKLYKKVLNSEYYHSVRDERSKEYLESLGLKAINTGCVTMWMLTPEFCKSIPTQKADKCVFTLTAGTNDSETHDKDQLLIDILLRNYKEVYFWVQGDKDDKYLSSFSHIENIKIINPSLEAYESILNDDDIEYVGTRLHGGIYAMRHKKRAIIISIDERAEEINKKNHLNCITRSDIEMNLEKLINSSFETKIVMDFEAIDKWRNQFRR